jgi:S1-C subfamily serine protease
VTLLRRQILVCGAVAALGASVPAAVCADQSDTIDRVKPSVVVVGTYQATRNPRFQFRGTGFAVGNGSLIATNAHVIPLTLDTENLETLTVLTRLSDGKIMQRKAEPVAADPDHDLTLLRVGGPPFTPLQLGDPSEVREGRIYLFTGYPLGEALGAFPVTHRAMIAAVAPIAIPPAHANKLDPQLIRRLTGGAFEIFQLDATAYPGNSGSPLYDPVSGAVVGILNMVFVKGTKEAALTNPSGISYAIPARHIADLLKTVR